MPYERFTAIGDYLNAARKLLVSASLYGFGTAAQSNGADKQVGECVPKAMSHSPGAKPRWRGPRLACQHAAACCSIARPSLAKPRTAVGHNVASTAAAPCPFAVEADMRQFYRRLSFECAYSWVSAPAGAPRPGWVATCILRCRTSSVTQIGSILPAFENSRNNMRSALSMWRGPFELLINN